MSTRPRMESIRNLTGTPKGKRRIGTSPAKATARKGRANKGKGENHIGAPPRAFIRKTCIYIEDQCSWRAPYKTPSNYFENERSRSTSRKKFQGF